MAGANNQLAVSLAQLRQAAASQEAAINAANAQLQATTEVETSLSAGWTGAAAVAFRSALTNFTSSGQQMVSALEEMHNAMMGTHDVLSTVNDQTDAAAQAAVKAGMNLPSGLPGL
jgi:WXG100 family type VII secretion target